MYTLARARVFIHFWVQMRLRDVFGKVSSRSVICAGCNRRLKIAEMLNLFESLRWYFMKDLIYASNICTSLTTNKSSGYSAYHSVQKRASRRVNNGECTTFKYHPSSDLWYACFSDDNLVLSRMGRSRNGVNCKIRCMNCGIAREDKNVNLMSLRL